MPISPGVPVLLATCGPPDVSRHIASIVVDSVDAVSSRRPGSDVFKECFEGISPFLTHPDTTGSIVPIGTVVLPVAARFHVQPCRILGTLIHPVGSHEKFLPTPTGLDRSSSNLIGPLLDSIPARTLELPEPVPMPVSAPSPNHGEPVELDPWGHWIGLHVGQCITNLEGW